MMRLMLVGLWLAGASAFAGEKAKLNALGSVTCKPTATGVSIEVEAAEAPVFTVFRLNEPDRLVVDVTGATTAAIKGHHDCVGPATGVVASQFSDSKAEVARLLIGLDGASRYDVRADGTKLVVSVDSAEARKEAVVAEAPAAAPKEAPAPVDGVVASHVDEIAVKNPATHLTQVAYRKGVLTLQADGEVGKFELIELGGPARLAVDVYGVKNSAHLPKVKDAMVREVRLGTYADKVRVVVEAAGAMPEYKASRTSKGLSVKLSAGAVQPVAAAAEVEAPIVEIDGKPVEAAETKAALVDVRGVEFAEAQGGGVVEVKLSGRAHFKVERPDATTSVLTIEGARIAKANEKSLDTSELQTPVKMVSAFAAPGTEPRVRIVVASGTSLTDVVTTSPSGLSWRLGSKASASTTTEAAVSGFATEATEVADSSAPAKRYVGKRVSFEFKDIDIHNLLRIIAEISKKNIVVGDDVSGKVTVRLRNVPWDQALDLVLRSKGLGMEEMGNIVRVAPLNKLEEEAKSRLAKREADENNKPLETQLVPVNYALADQVQARVKDLLTKRGTVSVDSRTNTLIVRDVHDNLARVRAMVTSLDLPTPQVLIEARIVEANTTLQREVGIQWGGQGNLSPASGNATGLVFPNTVSVAGGIATGNSTGTAQAPQYAVSLPVGAQDGRGGALGFIFGSAGGALQLNLRLSALEAQGAVKTISAPKVTTLDNESARISQGISIPFSQVSAAGANTTFVEARLALDVTPHITQDGSVLMKISATNNQPDPANTGANGQPAIQRKEASTTVLVHDSDTTVIGGIYVRTGSSTSSGVPILSKIPILGFFFRNYRELETKQELLIFITPRILNRQVVSQAL